MITKTTPDRTPEQWAEFCAREVMGWTIYTDPTQSFKQWWVGSDGQARHDMRWSPWRNLADALGVLEKLREGRHVQVDFARQVSATIYWNDDDSHGGWGEQGHGTNLCEAVCELAEKVMDLEGHGENC
jgi:hypothetical protein